MSITGNQRFVIVTRYDTACEVWDIRLKRLVHVYRNNYSQLNAASCLSPDESKLVIASENPDNDVLVFKNVVLAKCSVSVGEHSGIDMKTRIGIFVLDALLDERDKTIRMKIIKEHPGLIIYPFEWNILHVSAIYFGDIQSAKACLDAGIHLRLDNQGLTPIHHQFKKSRPSFEFLCFIFDNFESFLPPDPVDRQKIIESLSSVFLSIVSLGTNSAANVLNYFVSKPLPSRGVEVPEYGLLRHREGEPQAQQKFVVTDTPFLKYSVASRHVKSSSTPITLKMLRLKYNYEFESEDMMNLIYQLKKSHNDAIFNSAPVKILTEYVWTNNVKLHQRMAFIYMIFLILYSVWVGDRANRNDGLSVVAFIFGMVFLPYEIIQFKVLGIREYFSSIYRTLDLGRMLLLIITFIYIWGKDYTFDANDESSLRTKGWLLSITLAMSYAKFFSFFRIREKPRKFIRFLSEAVKEIFTFLVVTLFVLIAAALCFMQFEYTQSFGDRLLQIFDYLFGVYYDQSYNSNEYVLFVISLVILVIILLNMLISVILDTHEKLQNKNNTLESKEKLDLTLEALIFS